jgi:hypothetical protein
MMFFYLVAMIDRCKGKIIAKYGNPKSAFDHKTRLEQDKRWRCLEVHASNQNKVKNQILNVSELHVM